MASRYGRKRHILTDTDGRLLTVTIHSAGIQDRDGGKMVLKASRARYPFVTRAFVDGGYAGGSCAGLRTIVVEVVKRSSAAKGFELLRRRWVVERTFAWIIKNRGFVRDHLRGRDAHYHRGSRNSHSPPAIV